MSNPVSLALDSTLVLASNAREMGRMYLPDDDIGNRWEIQKFTWKPSDASLAALPFPLVPDTDSLDAAGPATYHFGPTAYLAQAVLAEIPDNINPAGDTLGFVAGTLTEATLRISDRRITFELALSRRIPHVGLVADFPITFDDVAANFPTVTFADVDPDVSCYDVRLVHTQPGEIPVGGGTILAFESPGWKFKQIARLDATDYSGAAFDDSAWTTKAAAFGDGGDMADPSPAHTTLWQKTTRMWARRTLTGMTPGLPLDVTIRADESLVIYLDGVQVHASTPNGIQHTATIDGAYITSASMVMAVRVTDGSSSLGCYFDLELVQ